MKNWIDSFIRNKAYIHGIVVLGFALVSLLFYYPVLSGKTLLQSDILQYEGMLDQQYEDLRSKIQLTLRQLTQSYRLTQDR